MHFGSSSTAADNINNLMLVYSERQFRKSIRTVSLLQRDTLACLAACKGAIEDD